MQSLGCASSGCARDFDWCAIKEKQMRPLAGIKVLDMSRVLAGPFAGRILSDLGAEVVKLEPPEGDVTRSWGTVRAGLAGYYTQQNVGKRNVCIDLRLEGGAELVKELAKTADVLVENFRPGVMKKYGLDYEALEKLNPKLVMLSISGFGQEGPESGRAAYAPILHGESGWLQRVSAWNDQPIIDLNLSAADTNASLHGTIGLLAALRVAEASGQGQHIDMCMLDAFLATDDASHVGLDGGKYAAAGGLVWEAVGGPILTAGDFRWVWKRLSEVHGLEDSSPPGTEVQAKRLARTTIIQEFLCSFASREEMLAALDKCNLAWGHINTTNEAYDSPTSVHRATSREIDARDGGKRKVSQTPYKFSQSKSGLENNAVAPYRGEHNHAVLAEWLGAGEQEIRALSSSGILLSENYVMEEK